MNIEDIRQSQYFENLSLGEGAKVLYVVPELRPLRARNLCVKKYGRSYSEVIRQNQIRRPAPKWRAGDSRRAAIYEPSDGSGMAGGKVVIPFDWRVIGGSGCECLDDCAQIKAGG